MQATDLIYIKQELEKINKDNFNQNARLNEYFKGNFSKEVEEKYPCTKK